jgi:peptide/nickel transport system permease protein
MPSFLRYFINRLLSIPVTLCILSMLLYGIFMLTPMKVRASLYYASSVNLEMMSEEENEQLDDRIIETYHLDETFIIQYWTWIKRLVQGDWGYSQVHGEDVLSALLRRLPITVELAIYTMLCFIPLGLISGVQAGANRRGRGDSAFRFGAFIATSIPPFVMALVLMSIFYVGTHWFPPQRLGIQSSLFVQSDNWYWFTGFVTVDGFLNHRPDISLEAFRHLILPVLTVSLSYWGILGRVTRNSVIEEGFKDYVLAAQARGLPESMLKRNYLFRNALTPALTSTMLAAASLYTSIFIVEVIYDFKGISSLVLDFSLPAPDAPLLLGFAIFSVILVLFIMLILDLIIAAYDPRIREGLLNR